MDESVNDLEEEARRAEAWEKDHLLCLSDQTSASYSKPFQGCSCVGEGALLRQIPLASLPLSIISDLLYLIASRKVLF